MEIQNVEAAVKNAADSIRKMPAVRRHKNMSYAIVVKVGYEEIQKLRNDGYSYDIICKVLSENGALGANASPKNLCTAFLRETKRRLSRTQKNTSNQEASIVNTSTKRTDSVEAQQKTDKVAHNKEGETEKIDREKDLGLKMAGRVVETGLGKIVKKSDGSFSY